MLKFELDSAPAVLNGLRVADCLWLCTADDNWGFVITLESGWYTASYRNRHTGEPKRPQEAKLGDFNTFLDAYNACEKKYKELHHLR